jgi:hypothetical protein
MIELLKFILSSFWTWLGTVLLITVTVSGIERIINAILSVWQKKRIADSIMNTAKEIKENQK